MKILGIITARGGSKGVPKKNIKLLGNKPLIAYTIEKSLQCNLLNDVIVSTDDTDIANIAKKFGAKIPFIRPSVLATDTASSISVVQHAVEFLEQNNEYFDAICLLQPTSPFRENGFLDFAISTFINNNADALVSVLPVPHEFNPHWVFEPNDNQFLKIATGENEIIKRRQDLPKAFYRDGSVYITKTEYIKKGTFYGNKLSYIESNPAYYVNIDTLDDWDIAEKKLPTLKNYL